MRMSPPKSVLVVDDEPGMRVALQASFRRDGWTAEVASGVTEAIQRLEQTRFPLVITDVRMPDGDGLEVMRHAKRSAPETAVILLTAFGNVPQAVEAIQSGACDYLMKPVTFEQLRSCADRILEKTTRSWAAAENGRIVGASPALRQSIQRAAQAALTDADILIEAESGTGKELVARFIHEKSSRHARPFVAVNCAAVPEHLLESDLFGHMKGAFTGATANKPGKFELAEGGTLLLDEVGEMPLGLQPKLLRVLQEREFERLGDTHVRKADVRVIATTNVRLQEMIAEGRFRADLYYRLNVIPLTIPPLRERRDDIPRLAEHFAAQFAATAGKPRPDLLPSFLAGLQELAWPGNVRELSNYIRRLIALAPTQVIGTEYLGPDFVTPNNSAAPLHYLALQSGIEMREAERRLLEATLDRTNGNRTRAAEMLGVSLRTVRNKIREYGLPPRRYALK